ncbi:MAG: 30S ribosomal protein S21 [Patescibacteria group bacterium]
MSKHRPRISIHVTKKQGESNDKMVARFQKLVKGSRIINETKDKRYFTKPLKKLKLRIRALKREEFRAKREKERFL